MVRFGALWNLLGDHRYAGHFGSCRSLLRGVFLEAGLRGVAVGGIGLLGALFAFRHARSPVVGLSHAARLAGRGQSHQWVLRGPVPERWVSLVVLLVGPHAT